MNLHICKPSPKKYSLMLIYPFALMAILLSSLEFYFDPLDGDLTRVGYLQEKDFGWQTPQPLVPAQLLISYPLSEADVLVIGDSFSASLIWQSRLASKHLKLSTLHWGQLKPCGDIGLALRRSGFKGHYVIIESVERFFQNRMVSICKKNRDIKAKAYSVSSPPTDRSLISLSKNPIGGDWMIRAIINEIKLAYWYRPYGSMDFNTVRMLTFLGGCDVFSHRLCNYVLFDIEDFEKKTFASIDNVLAIDNNLRESGIQPIWLVVPDKATVYLGYGKLNKNPYVNIWDEFAKRPELLAPNLGEVFIQKSRTVKDFYKPNDTHLSTSGLLFLGDLVADRIRNLKQAHLSL